MIQSIGARYVPRFRGTYNNTISYEALDVVDNGSGTSYISKIPTPAGVPLTNTTYWMVYGAYSGAVIDLLNQLSEVRSNLTWFVITPDMTQAEIQTAIAEHDNIYFTPGEYHYIMSSNGLAYIQARNNMNLWIDGTLIWDGDAYSDGSLIGIRDVDNVKVFGNGTLIGNKYTHDTVLGFSELENCITIMDSSNISIEGLTCKEAWGDGIVIAGINPGRNSKSTDIYINNVVCDDNRRNGLSISSAERCTVTNSTFINTGHSIGTAPMAGIAVETDDLTQTMKDISFVNCISKDNINHAAYVTAHTDSYVRFDDCTLISDSSVDAFPLYPGAGTPSMNVIMRGCIVEGRTGVKITNFNSNCKFDIQDTTFRNLTEALIETDSLLNKCIIKAAVIDSSFAFNLFKCFSGDSNIVTNCVFELDLINTTSAETGRPYFINKDNTIVKISNNTIRHFPSEAEVPFTFNRYEFDDTDYAGGIRNINIIDGCYTGSEYIIHNGSSYDLGLYTGGAIPASGTDPVSIKAGKAAIVKRFDSSIVMAQYLNQ